jgi:hypothetical protein
MARFEFFNVAIRSRLWGRADMSKRAQNDGPACEMDQMFVLSLWDGSLRQEQGRQWT